MMTAKFFNILCDEAVQYQQRDAYISDLAISSLWGDDPGAEIPEDRLELLGRIWELSQLTVKAIRTSTGLSQAKFAERFLIPPRTIEDWERDLRTPPRYVIYLLALATGLAEEIV